VRLGKNKNREGSFSNKLVKILQKPNDSSYNMVDKNQYVNNQLIGDLTFTKCSLKDSNETNQLIHHEMGKNNLPRLQEMPRLPDIQDYKIKVIKQEKLFLLKLGESLAILGKDKEVFKRIFTKVENVFRHPQNGESDILFDYNMDLIKKELARRKVCRELRFVIFVILGRKIFVHM
jgi:hypothetical protein